MLIKYEQIILQFFLLRSKIRMKGKLKFDNNPIKNAKIYNLHLASIQDEQYYAKVFNQHIIEKYALDQALEFNIEVLSDSKNFIYSNNFLHIEGTFDQKQAVVLLTHRYDYRLDQFLKKNGPLNERSALKIFQQIFKAAYSLMMAGYWHRNLRAEHFVKCGEYWKLQSIVFSQIISKEGLQSEYVYNTENQPPEAYQRPDFTEQQLDQRIVWDLGCILIHLLLGNHKLKNQTILDKFKNQPFSFKKISAAKGEDFSQQLKDLLGKMCHYNEKDRMTLDKLISNGFFSKQIAKNYAQQKQKQEKKIFIGGSSSVSQSLGMRNNKIPGVQVVDADRIAENLRKSDKKGDNLLSSKNDGKIQAIQKFKSNITSIIQQQPEGPYSSEIKKEESKKIQKFLSLQQINNQQLNQIIELYKNYLDKGQILSIGADKFQAMITLFDNPEQGNDLIQLTQFAVNFVKSMDLCRLAKAMNQNKQFFKLSATQWEKFHGTPEYKALKKLVNYRMKQSILYTQKLRQKIKGKNNKFVKEKQNIKIFVNNCNPAQTQFADIKQAYRRILKLSYDLIAFHYTKNKTVQWGRLGMYLTFCLAIDKMYIEQEFQDNFKYYFSWSKKPRSNYVSLYEFQQYLERAPRTDLVQNSRHIIEKFYEI